MGVLYCFENHTDEQNLRLNKYLIRWLYQYWSSSDIFKYCKESDIVNMAIDYDLSSAGIFQWIENAINKVYEPIQNMKHSSNLIPINCLYENRFSKNKKKKMKKKMQQKTSQHQTTNKKEKDL